MSDENQNDLGKWVKLTNHKMLSIKNENVFGLIFLILFLVFAYWKITSSQKEAKVLFNKLQSQYDQLNLETIIDNDIEKTFYPSKWRGGKFIQYVTLSGDRKFRIEIDECISQKEIYLDELLKNSVRLVKKNGSDTLVVIDRKHKYLFKLKIDKK